MPKRDDAYMADRRAQILDAVHRCVERVGWERATVDDVAREAGLSKGAVYVHFQSKRELLSGMLERDLVDIEQRARNSNLTALHREMNERLAPLIEAEGWRKAGAILETRMAAARDPEIHAKLASAGDLAVEVLASMARARHPNLSPKAARLWALGLYSIMNGIAALRSFGTEIAEAESRRLIAQQFDRLLDEAKPPTQSDEGAVKTVALEG
jgi:AcrR family transcriptional regulator